MCKAFKESIMKDLIIVESPAKVKTIKKFLGSKFLVEASVGHIRDLPSKEIGVDEESFIPNYVTIAGKEKVVKSLKEAAAKAETVYLAPDPDREGEAIAWHIAESIKPVSKNIKRIQFNEITAKAVKEALENPREINSNLFEAQQARRVLDRLVGYKISPLLWKSVKRGISAGRVQSVALRLVVEREEERLAFVPEEYWNFKAMVSADSAFRLDLAKINQKKVNIPNEETALAVENALKGQNFVVEKVEEKERNRSPLPPFTTSTLQQAANQRLNFGAKRTMTTAQRLYEGIDIEGHGTLALITYMRTDSVRIAAEAITSATEFIAKEYGKEYCAAGGNGRAFKGKKSAQDAHEAIRPVDVNVLPEQIKHALTPEQYKLYNLIWARFVASQMAVAKFHDTNVTVVCENKNSDLAKLSEVEKNLYPFHSQWKTKGERLLFPGFLKVMSLQEDKIEELPALSEGQVLKLDSITKEQKFTQPSPRYTEASLVRELEEKGIGRPSTYATIISTIQDREYVRLENKHFVPTDLGNVVCSQLRDNFPKLMNVDFTAGMEENLDKVADGEMAWVKLLSEFNTDFVATLEKASKEMKAVKSGIETNYPCPKCEKPLNIKFGKSGEFVACTGYPECKFTSNFSRDENGDIQLQAAPEYEVVGECPKCKGDVVLKKSRMGGRFLACSNYPKCDFIAPFSTGVKCPACDEGVIVEKSSKKGKIFYSCNTYPKCDFALWDYPIAKPCPKCDSPVLVRKYTKTKGHHIACPEKKCSYTYIEGEDGEFLETEPTVQLLLDTQPSKAKATTEKVKKTTKKSTVKAKEDELEEVNNKKEGEVELTEKPKRKSSAKTKKEEIKDVGEKVEQSLELTSPIKDSNLKQVKIFTDGSCLGNPGNGAYAAILDYAGKRKEVVGGFTNTTNNRMELLGVIEGLNLLKEPCLVELYTDSQYVAKAINNGWLANWKKNGWKTSQKKPVKNQDLWIKFDEAISKHQVNFNWVKGHAGHEENERCDELARTEAAKPDLPNDAGYEGNE